MHFFGIDSKKESLGFTNMHPSLLQALCAVRQRAPSYSGSTLLFSAWMIWDKGGTCACRGGRGRERGSYLTLHSTSLSAEKKPVLHAVYTTDVVASQAWLAGKEMAGRAPQQWTGCRLCTYHHPSSLHRQERKRSSNPCAGQELHASQSKPLLCHAASPYHRNTSCTSEPLKGSHHAYFVDGGNGGRRRISGMTKASDKVRSRTQKSDLAQAATITYTQTQMDYRVIRTCWSHPCVQLCARD